MINTIKVESLFIKVNNALKNQGINENIKRELENLLDPINKLKNQYFSMKKYIDSLLGEDGASRNYDGGNLELLYQRVTFNYGKTNSEKLKEQLQSVYKPLCNARNELTELNNKIDMLIMGSSNIPNYNVVRKDDKAIGFTIINILGVILVIIGLSIFGKYVYIEYFSDIAKGITLYLFGAIILGISELFVRRKNEKFSEFTTALGISILYMATFINSLYLDNFNYLIAISISILISIISILFSYYKGYLSIRIISLIGGYISLIPLSAVFLFRFSIKQSIVIAIFYVILNATNLILPLKYKKKNMDIFIISTVIINSIFLFIIKAYLQIVPFEAIMIFNLCTILYMNKILFKEIKNYTLDIYLYVIAILFVSFNLNLLMASLFLIVSIISFVLYKDSIKLSSYLSGMIVALNFIGIAFNFVTIKILITSLFLAVGIYYWTKVRNIIVQATIYLMIGYLFMISIKSSLIDATMVLVIITAITLLYSSFKDRYNYIALKQIFIIEGIVYIANIVDQLEIYKFAFIFIGLFMLGAMLLFNLNKSLLSESYKIDNMIYVSCLLFISIEKVLFTNYYSIGFLFIVMIIMYIFFRKEYIPFDISRRTSNIITGVVSIIYILAMVNVISVLGRSLISIGLGVFILIMSFIYSSKKE